MNEPGVISNEYNQLRNLMCAIDLLGKTHFKNINYSVSLTKLSHELQEVIENPSKEEFADCFIALFDAYIRAHGCSNNDLSIAVFNKININMNREWKQNEDGTYSHIKK